MSEEIQSADTTEAAAEPPAMRSSSGGPATSEAPKPSMFDSMDRIGQEIISREPVRGSDGRFQPKIAAEGANGVEVPGSPKAAPPDPQPEVIEAPQSLPADVKSQWATLPPSVQKYWADREGEVHKKLTADGERIKSLSAFEEVAATIQDRARQLNAPPAEYFRRLAAADQLLAQDGIRGIQQIAQMYGIDLRSAFQPGAQPDPNSALARELAQVKSTLTAITQQHEADKLGAAQKTIDDFKKDKPHFDAVEPLIVTLMEGKAAKDLNEAYTMAIKAHPEVGKLIEAEAKAAAEKKAADEAKEKAAKDAKLAPQAKRPGSTPTAPLKGKNMYETMDRVGREVIARAD